MLSKHVKQAQTSARALSVVAPTTGSAGRNPPHRHQLQQSRTILGLIPAVDKRLYRLAKGVMPPISKTEQIALGCGTIGKEDCTMRKPIDIHPEILTFHCRL
jgi:hypothetical protein